jgi:hypothetical protein
VAQKWLYKTAKNVFKKADNASFYLSAGGKVSICHPKIKQQKH